MSDDRSHLDYIACDRSTCGKTSHIAPLHPSGNPICPKCGSTRTRILRAAVVESKGNPKEAQAASDGKDMIQNIPLWLLKGDAAAHTLGANKYGRFNWREDPIKMSTYLGAMIRHIVAWSEGEETDPESGFHHLYHVRACCAVVLDATEHGTVHDDLNSAESKSQ